MCGQTFCPQLQQTFAAINWKRKPEGNVGQMTQLQIATVTTGEDQSIQIDPVKLERLSLSTAGTVNVGVTVTNSGQRGARKTVIL